MENSCKTYLLNLMKVDLTVPITPADENKFAHYQTCSDCQEITNAKFTQTLKEITSDVFKNKNKEEIDDMVKIAVEV